MGNNTVTVDVTHIVTDYVTDFVIANIQFCTRIWTINWPVFTIFIYPDAEGFCSDVLCLFIFLYVVLILSCYIWYFVFWHQILSWYFLLNSDVLVFVVIYCLSWQRFALSFDALWLPRSKLYSFHCHFVIFTDLRRDFVPYTLAFCFSFWHWHILSLILFLYSLTFSLLNTDRHYFL